MLIIVVGSDFRAICYLSCTFLVCIQLQETVNILYSSCELMFELPTVLSAGVPEGVCLSSLLLV